MLERKDNTKENKFLLSPEQKVALMEAKIARAQAQIQSLVEQAKAMEKSRSRK
jgi:hypothetical protein